MQDESDLLPSRGIDKDKFMSNITNTNPSSSASSSLKDASPSRTITAGSGFEAETKKTDATVASKSIEDVIKETFPEDQDDHESWVTLLNKKGVKTLRHLLGLTEQDFEGLTENAVLKSGLRILRTVERPSDAKMEDEWKLEYLPLDVDSVFDEFDITAKQSPSLNGGGKPRCDEDGITERDPLVIYRRSLCRSILDDLNHHGLVLIAAVPCSGKTALRGLLVDFLEKRHRRVKVKSCLKYRSSVSSPEAFISGSDELFSRDMSTNDVLVLDDAQRLYSPLFLQGLRKDKPRKSRAAVLVLASYSADVDIPDSPTELKTLHTDDLRLTSEEVKDLVDRVQSVEAYRQFPFLDQFCGYLFRRCRGLAGARILLQQVVHHFLVMKTNDYKWVHVMQYLFDVIKDRPRLFNVALSFEEVPRSLCASVIMSHFQCGDPVPPPPPLTENEKPDDVVIAKRKLMRDCVLRKTTVTVVLNGLRETKTHLTFSTDLHLICYQRRIFPLRRQIAMPETIDDLIRVTVAAMEPAALSNAQCWGANLFPKERGMLSYQFYRALMDCLPVCNVVPEYSKDIPGFLDFWVQEKMWSLELMRNGNPQSIANHVGRFNCEFPDVKGSGRYIGLGSAEWRVIDFRSSTEGAPTATVWDAGYIAVVFSSDFKTARLWYPSDRIRVSGRFDNDTNEENDTDQENDIKDQSLTQRLKVSKKFNALRQQRNNKTRKSK